MDRNKVEKLAVEALQKHEAFLVNLQVSEGNEIAVQADKLKGITLEELSQISQSIEEGLNRDEEDFKIEVTSPGVGNPLQVKEQYVQNVGRPVKVTLKDGEELSGELQNFENDQLTLTWKAREPKPEGKGKVTVQKEREIPLTDVAHTKVEVRF